MKFLLLWLELFYAQVTPAQDILLSPEDHLINVRLGTVLDLHISICIVSFNADLLDLPL